MKEEKLEKLLNELTGITAEPVRPGLAEDIKHQIPHRFAPHRGGMDTVNIIIDLRISKLAAAAAIAITTVLLASFLGGRDLSGGGIYQDGKMLVKYLLGGDSASKSQALVGMSELYEHLVRQGKEVVYYGNNIDPEDSNAVLMQWKLPDGKYRVTFGDLRAKTVTAEELVELQAQMLQKKK
jgi:hypothetical protein